jgi:hypothetical protein
MRPLLPLLLALGAASLPAIVVASDDVQPRPPRPVIRPVLVAVDHDGTCV